MPITAEQIIIIKLCMGCYYKDELDNQSLPGGIHSSGADDVLCL